MKISGIERVSPIYNEEKLLLFKNVSQ